MATSLVLFALAGSLATTAAAETLTWETDYAAAYRQADRDRKPMVVVFGSGPKGWQTVCKEGKFGSETETLLTTHYVRVYVDTGSEAGRKLATSFEIGEDATGLVISDHGGENQAYRVVGKVAAADLETALKKYADSDRKATTTEGPGRTDVRYYQGPSTYAPYTPAYTPNYAPYYAPAMGNFGGFGGFGGGGGGGC